MSHNPKTSHLSTTSIAFDMSSNKKWREMSRGLTYTFAAVLFVRRDFSSAAPRQLSSEVMLCEAILFHFLKHFTRNFQTHLYKINDDCHSNLCYWFPLAFFNIRPHPPKKPNRWRKTKKHQRKTNEHVFVSRIALSPHKCWMAENVWLSYWNHKALNRFSCILDLFNLKSHLHE